ncbi:MAG: amidohydrolase [Burkholderiales bacterium]|nr:amidohydrolase [Burkholderiales bacterium]
MRAGEADLILCNGKVITVDGRFRIAEAVAICADRFVAVGGDAEVRELAGPATRVVDLGGRAVVPGLIDGHAHVDREGLKLVFPSLGKVRSIADIQERIAALVRGARPGEWIVTMPIGDPPTYFNVPEILRERRFPTRHDLDRVAPRNPVYIRSIWGFWRHTTPLVSIANTRALELAGITRETASPLPSVEIEKDASGEPTGVFIENTLMPVVELTLMRCAPGFSHADRVRTLPDALRAYHAFGTTSVFEEHGASAEVLRAYKEVRRRGGLTMRTALVVSPDWTFLDGVALERVVTGWFGWLSEPSLGDAFLRITGIYANIDVEEENRVRSRALPYTGWAGFHYDTSLSRERMRELLAACARNGIRVTTTRRNMLALYEEANRVAPIRDLRWVLGHVSTLTPGEVSRVRDLGLMVTTHTNRYIYKEGHLLQQRLGAEREDEISPLRALSEAGVRVSLATDNVPVSMFYPVWQSVARTSLYTGRAVAPGQRLSREDALRGATVNGAWLTFEEREKGSIEPGKLADLAVLNADPLTVDEDALKDIASDMTVVGGKVVWEGSRAP